MDVKFIRTKRRKIGHVGGFIFEVKKHVMMCVLLLIALTGLLTGNFFVKGNTDVYNTVSELFNTYISTVSGQTLAKSFLLHFTSDFFIFAVSFLFGLCAIGFPVPVLSVLMKSVSIGALSSFLYSEYALKGFGYCMLILYPIQLLNMLILMYFGKESISMSVALLKTLTEQKQKTGEMKSIKVYLLNFLVAILLNTVISFISAVLSVYVVKLFNF